MRTETLANLRPLLPEPGVSVEGPVPQSPGNTAGTPAGLYDASSERVPGRGDGITVQPSFVDAARVARNPDRRDCDRCVLLSGLFVRCQSAARAAQYGAACLDSALPTLFPDWTVHKLPLPMDEWLGWTIVSLFGITALLRRGR